MFDFFKRKKKKNPVGKIGKDELGPYVPEEEEVSKKPSENISFQPVYTPDFSQNIVKEKTLEEKAIEQIKNSSLKGYYDLMESTFAGKSTRDIVRGIEQEVAQIFAETGIKVDSTENQEQKMDNARKVFDYVVQNIAYDKLLTRFMRFSSENIYHENINREIMKEVYYGLRNHAGSCLSDACTLSYMFEKIGLDSIVIGLGDHAIVEVDIDGKKLYCDSTYEQGLLDGSDEAAIAKGKGYGAGFMQDETMLKERNYQKGIELPKMTLVFEANARKEELEKNQTVYFTVDDDTLEK